MDKDLLRLNIRQMVKETEQIANKITDDNVKSYYLGRINGMITIYLLLEELSGEKKDKKPRT